MQYKGFTLDSFQEEAIQAINRGHSVIVTAPTGAGKTVIAEYAVEKCLEAGKRIIYTAPIKALSNQKYRDFSDQYGDQIGILTGDVVINGDAPAVLMTTEVFRNTIFDNSHRLTDVEYVVFDEIHYINDLQRGTVWEESIIFAPQNIRFVCLSATIPNIEQFTHWMRSVREHPIETVEEHDRPVPLHHSLFVPGVGIGEIEAYRELHRTYHGEGLPLKGVPNFVRMDLIEYVQQRDQLPCLYFCFSRKGCEQNAAAHADRNLLTAEERDQIVELYDELCERYNITDEDRVVSFRQLVRRGVAYHHAGMLPTLKEVVERLFTSGLIKLLFTTETFAVGINMPACTAVFDSLEKYDGRGFRFLTAREYHQMAGRAGRRGIDPVGYVYASVNLRMNEPDEVQHAMLGEIEPIESQFNLAYSSVLSLYERHQDDIYNVCAVSLSNYQNVETIQEIDEEIQRMDDRESELEQPHCIHDGVAAFEEIGGFFRAIERYEEQEREFRQRRAAIKRRLRGSRNRQARNNQLNKLNRQRQLVYQKRSKFRCVDCRYQRVCGRKYQCINEYYEYCKQLRLQREHFENFQREQIRSRLAVLRELGYMDDEGLLPRGKIASQIYGCELQVTELMFEGILHQLPEDGVNVLLMALVAEIRKENWYRKLQDQALKAAIEDVRAIVDRIRRCELRHSVSEPVPDLETKLSTAMLAWSRGCEFEKLHDMIDMSDGDLVRSIRLVIDQLRQIRRAAADDERLRNKVSRCIDKIHRDVVDAERQLRIH